MESDPLAIPAFLRIPIDERRAAWALHPPRPMPCFQETKDEDASTKAFRAQLEAERKAKSYARVARFKPKAPNGVPAGMRWDTLRNRWRPI